MICCTKRQVKRKLHTLSRLHIISAPRLNIRRKNCPRKYRFITKSMLGCREPRRKCIHLIVVGWLPDVQSIQPDPSAASDRIARGVSLAVGDGPNPGGHSGWVDQCRRAVERGQAEPHGGRCSG